MRLADLFLLGCVGSCLRAFICRGWIMFLKRTLNYYVNVHFILIEIVLIF